MKSYYHVKGKVGIIMSNQRGGSGSEIQEECRKLQRTADVVGASWCSEVLCYEKTSNKPNSSGVIDDSSLFPYHNLLYSLLDCFDGLEDNRNSFDSTIISPSPAPLPDIALNGNRRKKSFPAAVDSHGVDIMELSTLDGHLPNSAWAIRSSIMPLERQEQFANVNDDSYKNRENSAQEQQYQPPPGHEVNDGRRHRNPRFWNILMDSKSEITRIASSNISLPPTWDGDGFEDDDDSNNWEYIEDDSNNTSNTTTSLDLLGNGNLARNFTFLSWWEQTLINERRGVTTMVVPQASLPSYLYLKVLMHSLSELQCDHRLARAVLLLLTDCKSCSTDSSRVDEDEGNGLECFRRLLSVLSFGYTPCDGYCHETYIEHDNAGDLLDDDLGVEVPNHYCSDWWEFLASVSTLIGYGIENMTNQHASIICAFFVRELDMDESSENEQTNQKVYLKQNLHFMNNEGIERDEDDEPSTITHVHLLSAILNGIKIHAISDRMRLGSLSNDADENSDNVNPNAARIIYQSFNVCVNILVDIGERILLRLPTNFVNRQLAGLVVRGLLESFLDNAMDETDSVACYLSHQNIDSKLRSVVDPLRYANAISNSSEHPLINQHLNTKAREQKIGHPPRDVQDLVKGLFRRDLVDLNIAGFGYGDFLCWLHLPIQPEPLLFDYVSNFPQEDEGEEPSQEYEWVQDEHGFTMEYPHLVACYDFSLLMLIREWNRPWTPQSHLSYSLPFRNAITSLALCAHRYGVPASIVEIVNSFLPRSWFDDDRMCCWSHECQVTQLSQLYREKISLRSNNWDDETLIQPKQTLQRKPRRALSSCGCKVAMVCCKDHLKKLHQEGHKRQCGLPPFRPPYSKDDNMFVREMFEGSDSVKADGIGKGFDDQSNADQNEDDTDSWESVDTNAEDIQRCTMHDKIYSWFNRQSYKIQRREAPAPPFANFY